MVVVRRPWGITRTSSIGHGRLRRSRPPTGSTSSRPRSSSFERPRPRQITFALPTDSANITASRPSKLVEVRPRPLPLPANALALAASPLPLTFGVEMEYIFTTDSVPRPGYEWFYDISKEDFVPVADDDDSVPRNHPFRNTERAELWGSHRALTHAGLEAVIDGEDASTWGLHADCSVGPVHEQELVAALDSRMRGVPSSWPCTGAELVTRVLTAPDTSSTRQATLLSDPSIKEIESYLTALKGTANDPFGAYVNDTCGLHIHIGLDPNKTASGSSMLPLPVLQHLAFMLVHFESLISSLQPYDRRATFMPNGGTSNLLGSNLMGLKWSGHICGSPPLPLMEQIESLIFHPEMTAYQLANLMSESGHFLPEESMASRYKFVNFKRVLDATNPSLHFERRQELLKTATIEFRQHEGTLEIEDIARWVQFVVSLVRAAEKKAVNNQPATPLTPKTPRTLEKNLEIHMSLPLARQQGNKYRLRCTRQADEFERLFDLLDFDRLTRRYWLDRYRKFNPDEVLPAGEKEFDCITAGVKREECPKCRVEMAREEEFRRMDDQQRRERYIHDCELQEQVDLLQFYLDHDMIDSIEPQRERVRQYEYQGRQILRTQELDRRSWEQVELYRIFNRLRPGPQRDELEQRIDMISRLIEMLEDPLAHRQDWEALAYLGPVNPLVDAMVIEASTSAFSWNAEFASWNLQDQEIVGAGHGMMGFESRPSSTRDSPDVYLPGAYPSGKPDTPATSISDRSLTDSHQTIPAPMVLSDELRYYSFPGPDLVLPGTRHMEKLDDYSTDDDSDKMAFTGQVSSLTISPAMHTARDDGDGSDASDISMDISQGASPVEDVSEAMSEMDICKSLWTPMNCV